MKRAKLRGIALVSAVLRLTLLSHIDLKTRRGFAALFTGVYQLAAAEVLQMKFSDCVAFLAVASVLQESLAS